MDFNNLVKIENQYFTVHYVEGCRILHMVYEPMLSPEALIAFERQKQKLNENNSEMSNDL